MQQDQWVQSRLQVPLQVRKRAIALVWFPDLRRSRGFRPGHRVTSLDHRVVRRGLEGRQARARGADRIRGPLPEGSHRDSRGSERADGCAVPGARTQAAEDLSDHKIGKGL